MPTKQFVYNDDRGMNALDISQLIASIACLNRMVRPRSRGRGLKRQGRTSAIGDHRANALLAALPDDQSIPEMAAPSRRSRKRPFSGAGLPRRGVEG
jgi:hypothetical protein